MHQITGHSYSIPWLYSSIESKTDCALTLTWGFLALPLTEAVAAGEEYMPGGRQVAPQHNQKILKKGIECSVVDEYVKNIQWRQATVKKKPQFFLKM